MTDTKQQASPAADRLADAALVLFAAAYRSSDVSDYYNELQELYNAAREVKGLPCEHDWFPKVAYIGGLMFTHCGKCGLKREPDDAGIKVRTK